MGIANNIIEELERYKKINNYILEQEATTPPEEPNATETGGDTPPPPPADAGAETPPADTTSEPIDVNADPDVEKIGDEGKTEHGSEELDITDLVNSQKNIETKQEDYFNNLFSQLNNLESKLGEMNSVIEKLNQIEAKIEKYREKTPQEKLELRSIDSGPFNQKLTDFFSDKSEDIEKTGKNEYVLTTDEIEDYSPSEIKNTFNDMTLNSNNGFKPIKF
jgi:hypothetical protein